MFNTLEQIFFPSFLLFYILNLAVSCFNTFSPSQYNMQHIYNGEYSINIYVKSISRQSSQRTQSLLSQKTTSHLNIGLIYCMYRWHFHSDEGSMDVKKFIQYQTLCCICRLNKAYQGIFFYSIPSTNLHNSFMIYSNNNNKVRMNLRCILHINALEKILQKPLLCKEGSEM